MSRKARLMPAKKHQMTDAERAKRVRELARETEASNDPADLERALEKVAKPVRDSKVKSTK